MHLAGKANSLYHTGKQIASIFMPELKNLGLYDRITQGFSALDSMRDNAISRHQDVLDRTQSWAKCAKHRRLLNLT